MRDETSDGSDAGRLARAAEANEGDDARAEGDGLRAEIGESLSDAEGEVDPSSGTRDAAVAAESVDSAAAHRRWMTVAAACAVAAAVLLFTVGVNAAFVAAVLGVVAWFWDQRNRIRAHIIEDGDSEEGRDELEEFDDEDDEGGHDAGKQRNDEV